MKAVSDDSEYAEMGVALRIRRRRRLAMRVCICLAVLSALLAWGGGCVYFLSIRYNVPFRLYGRYEEYIGGGLYKGEHFSLSPDGKMIVYSSPRTGHGDLYLVGSDGAHTRRLTSNPNYEGNPSFSPDGSKVTYEREQNKCGHIWIVNADGTGQKQLTFGSAYDSEPRFTPDGLHIWFTREPQGTLYIYEYSVDLYGKHVTPVLSEDPNVYPWELSFTHKSKLVYYNHLPNGIRVMHLDGTQNHRLGR